MKKLITIILLFSTFLSFAGCTATTSPDVTPPENTPYQTATPTESATPTPSVVTPTPTSTPTPKPTPGIPEETISTASLAEYTIIYPAEYADWQMEEIYLLQAAIEHVTGVKIKVESDATQKSGKEIIFSCSGRSTALDSYIASFENRLDYTIGVSNSDIVLGGKDYYGNMRAAYYFINTVLGYDDLQGSHTAAQESITGVTTSFWEEPAFVIAAGNFYKRKYPDAQSVKDVADAGFNVMIVQGMQRAYESEAKFRQFVNWCTRFGLTLILPMNIDTKNVTFTLPFLDAYEDNPIVWGHYVKDEPTVDKMKLYSDIADKYKEQYGAKGWKALINHLAGLKQADYLEEMSGLFDSTDVLAFDLYFGHALRDNSDPNVIFDIATVLENHELLKIVADRNGQPFWTYIMAYYLDQYNTSKMFRWSSYICMSLGSDAILYFNYQGHIVTSQFDKTEHYYNAQKANKEILTIGNIIEKDYDYVGAYFKNASSKDTFTYIENSYNGFNNVITDFKVQSGNKSPYLIGCFDKKASDGHAFTIVNVSELDYVPYEKTSSEPVKLKINGSNITFYRDGIAENITPDADGYYELDIGNGCAWFVTVD